MVSRRTQRDLLDSFDRADGAWRLLMAAASLSRERLMAEDCRGAVERCGTDLDILRGHRVLLTGGTGFFGTWLLECCAWAMRERGLDCEIWALSRDPEAFGRKAPHLARHPQIRLFAGDVRNFALPVARFGTIIHAAAEASAKLNAEDPLLMIDTIVEGTRHVLELARTCGSPRTLFVSSGGVYGPQPAQLEHVTEGYLGGPDVTAPKNAYNEAKRFAELLCATYAARYDLDIKLARCFAFVGPFLPLDAHFAVGNFIRDGLQGAPIIIKGDGTPYRSYQYASDLVVWLLAILNRGQRCRPYNVGSAEAISIADLAREVAAAFAPSPEVRVLSKSTPGVLPERYVPSVDRASQELGVANSVSLREAIRKTIAWHRSALVEA